MIYTKERVYINNSKAKLEPLDDDTEKYLPSKQLSITCVVSSLNYWLPIPLNVVVQTHWLNLTNKKLVVLVDFLKHVGN